MSTKTKRAQSETAHFRPISCASRRCNLQEKKINWNTSWTHSFARDSSFSSTAAYTLIEEVTENCDERLVSRRCRHEIF